MAQSRGIRAAVVAVVSVALVLPACTTQQLQKQYTSFDSCFKDQKVLATAGGALLGAVLGSAVGGGGKSSVAIGAMGALLGGIVGNRIAWESCLKAFPPRAQTTVIAPIAAAGTSTQAPTRALTIQSVVARPLVLGRDLEVSYTYFFASERANARDIKARVHRNLVFVAPDGSQHEIASSTEDVIQQGTSRSNFAIPTPSPQEAPELAQTRDWRFKLVVEVEGMRQEQVISLSVPQLNAGAAQSAAAAMPTSASAVAAPPAQPPSETINLRAGTALLSSPGASQVVSHLRSNAVGRVLQKTLSGGYQWLQVELQDGSRGWLRGVRR